MNAKEAFDKIQATISDDLSTDEVTAIIQSAITASTRELTDRITTLEATLAEAAAKLQNVLPIGRVKAIGLCEVPAAIDMLIAEKDAEIATLRAQLDNSIPMPTTVGGPTA